MVILVKVAIIAPIHHLSFSQRGDMHFIVTAHLEFEEARKFFESETKYKMLDNGSYEFGIPLEGEELIELAKSIKADEIVVPDYFMDRKRTLRAAAEFLDRFGSEKFSFCIVPQATCPEEFIYAFKQIMNDRRFGAARVIAFPIWLQKRFRCRPIVVSYLLRRGIMDMSRHYHLLGLDGIGELFAYPQGLIRSVDTSLPFSLTYNKVLETPFGDFDGQRMPLDGKLHYQQLPLLEKHITNLLGAAHGNDTLLEQYTERYHEPRDELDH